MSKYKQIYFQPVQASLGLCASMACAGLGCAGPTTPLGAVWSITPPSAHAAVIPSKKDATIRFRPGSQVLHALRPLEILVEEPEPIGNRYHISLRYNGFDVSTTALAQASYEYQKGGKRLAIRLPATALSPMQDHRIELVYENPATGRKSAQVLPPPSCEAFETSGKILGTDVFNPSHSTLYAIERISRENGLNPAFVAGLIAQESGFNPQVVSWARAIGLTQITPSAEEEIIKLFPEWPRYAGINDLAYPSLRVLIMSGRANGLNEWRLDPEYSIQGGMAYLSFLLNRWKEQDNRAKVALIFDDSDKALRDLVLASYHSGYTRVLWALNRYGSRWMSAPGLEGAKFYVTRIRSYCDYFSHMEGNPI